MSDSPLFGGVGSRERLLWQAVLRLDDREIGDQLFALVAHQRMSRADADLVAKAYRDAATGEFFCLTRFLALIAVALELRLLDFEPATTWSSPNRMLAAIFAIVPFLIVVAYRRRLRENGQQLLKGITWTQCGERHSGFLTLLRTDSFVQRMPAPKELQIVQAIAEVIGQADNSSASDGEAASHAIPPSTVSLFRELLNQLPSDVDETNVYDLIKRSGDTDWRTRFIARYSLRIVGLGTPYIFDDEHWKLHGQGSPIFSTWQEKFTKEHNAIFTSISSWFCLRCLARFKTYILSEGGEDGPTLEYNACRSCRHSKYVHKVTQSVCVIDRHFATDCSEGVMIDSAGVLHRDPVSKSCVAHTISWPPSTAKRILMPWSPIQRPFDFELLYIGDTDDQEIEQFIAKILADSDKVRIKSRSTIAVRIAHPERLSANSLNLVRRLFPKALGTPGNPADIAKLDSLIAWTAPAVAAEVLS